MIVKEIIKLALKVHLAQKVTLEQLEQLEQQVHKVYPEPMDRMEHKVHQELLNLMPLIFTEIR